MAKPSIEVIILPSQTIAANGNLSSFIIVPQDYWGCILNLSTGTPTGTSPTLDVYIQQGFTAAGSADTMAGLIIQNTANPTLWDDYAHFAQVTSTAASQSQYMRILAEIGTSAANSPTAVISNAQSGALAASTVQPGPFGMFWRILWKVGGTSPSFPTVGITAQFVMPQG